MSKQKDGSSPIYGSCLALWFQRFIQEKRALGFRYRNEAFILGQFDRLLQKEGVRREELTRAIIDKWLIPQPCYASQTLSHRRVVVRQVAMFLVRNNISAYIPPDNKGFITRSDFTPWIFNHDNIRKLLLAVDSLPVNKRDLLGHLILPEIFRLLYGCGLRISEALQLQVRDVDLTEGILIIRQAKGDKDRLVPLAHSLKNRLGRYAKILRDSSPQAPFFPASHGRFYGYQRVYRSYRQLLKQIGISHGGRGKGPRLHDLRHTFAVHRLIRWYREGADLNTKLPLLATYLGHKNLIGTQHYLHLTAELFPDLTKNLESAVGNVIPRRNTQ